LRKEPRILTIADLAAAVLVIDCPASFYCKRLPKACRDRASLLDHRD
jgi:hypothetical protein